MAGPVPFREAAARFDPASFAALISSANQQRRTIIEAFPRSDWPELPLERYAVGQGDVQTFCRLAEFRSDDLGSISGGSADKLLIYRRKKTGLWRYPERYSSVEEAWIDVRAGFVRAFELADAGDWDGIGAIDALKGAGALRTKALHIYFSNDILPVYSRSHLEHYFKLVTGSGPVGSRLQTSRALLEALRSEPALATLSTSSLGKFLYWWADPRDQISIVKIAPGEDAKYWSDCLSGEYICVGWDEVGDLRAFEDKSDFRTSFDEQFRSTYSTKSKLSAKANELWTMRELEPGDIVVANQGQSRVLAVGQVVEPGYQWSDRESYRHTVRVKWDQQYARTLTEPVKSWATRTIAPVTSELYQQIVSTQAPRLETRESVRLPQAIVDPDLSEIAAALEQKGQVILYGPPGTGKTYAARRFAVDHLLAAEGRADRAAVLADPQRFEFEEQRLSASRSDSRVFWVVANPNEWSWDSLFDKGRVEFTSGRLRKNYDSLRKGDLVVGYASNPQKRLVALARVSSVSHDDRGPTFTLTALRRVTQGLTWDELREDSILAGSEPMRFNCQGTLFRLTDLEATHLFGRLSHRDESFSDPRDSDESVGLLTRLTFHASYSYEDFVEGFRPVDARTGGLSLALSDGIFKRICRAASSKPGQPYIVLIDELNRANVAKVMGELITVIEHDKRGLSVVLPQSREDFVIPRNVLVIGTMNTADRSIKLIDAALRRRFAFIEYLPDLGPLEGAEINGIALDDLLEKLNRRIVERAGREKQIGQAYFLQAGKPITDVLEFSRRFRYEVLPLLQEYCHEDYSKLAEYVGELVDLERQRFDESIVAKPERLVETLGQALRRAAESA